MRIQVRSHRRLALVPAVLGLTATLGFAAPPGEKGRGQEDAYILTRGNNTTSAKCSMDELRRVRGQLSGSFLWLRRGGQAYVVRDEAALQTARALFDGLDDLEPERDAVGGRQHRLEERDRALEREERDLDRIADRRSDRDEDGGEEHRTFEGLRRRLEARQRELEDEQRREDDRERALDAREEAIEQKAEAALWRLLDRAIADGVARPVRH